MRYNPSKHNRKSIRLKGHNYSNHGYYFITICIQDFKYLFGEIIDGEMCLNDAGKMIDKIYHEIIGQYDAIKTGEYVIMPNHFHCILQIVPVTKNVGADSISAPPVSGHRGAEIDSAPTVGLVSRVVQSFKRYTTIKYIEMVKNGIVPPFYKRLWQRNYWDYVVRNENELNRIGQYIINNPYKWSKDKLNGGDGNSVMESGAVYNEEIWMV